MRKPGPEDLALGLAAVLVLAFAVSFVDGLRLGMPAPAVIRPELETPAVDPGTEVRGRVEVLNASGRAGQARDATIRLRDAGFDVVYYGNASERSDSSIVIDRIGNEAIAGAVAKALGITRVISRVDSALLLDATVILGDKKTP